MKKKKNSGAIPIAKLVPRLPAIENGKVEQVNFGDFTMDKQSIGTIISGLSNKLCKLKSMRITIGTIKNLDIESCRSLGAFLKRKNINVTISQTVDSKEILKMFKMLDEEGKGFLTVQQFVMGHHILDESTTVSDNSDKSMIVDNMIMMGGLNRQSTTATMFNQLAIRKTYSQANADRVYFIDFYDSFTKTKQKGNVKYESKYDITSIKSPIHWIFYHLTNCVKNLFLQEKEKPQQLIRLSQLIELPFKSNEWNLLLNNLIKLFHFVVGLNQETQLSSDGNKYNVLITLVKTHKELSNIMTKNVRKSSIITANQITLSQNIFWFLDKLLIELLRLQSIKHMITLKYNIDIETSGIELITSTKNVEMKQDFGDIDDIVVESKEELKVLKLNSLEFSLCLRNFSYFAIIASSIDNDLNDNNNNNILDGLVNWNICKLPQKSKMDLFKAVLSHGSSKLLQELLDILQFAQNDIDLTNLIHHATMSCIIPSQGMF